MVAKPYVTTVGKYAQQQILVSIMKPPISLGHPTQLHSSFPEVEDISLLLYMLIL